MKSQLGLQLPKKLSNIDDWIDLKYDQAVLMIYKLSKNLEIILFYQYRCILKLIIAYIKFHILYMQMASYTFILKIQNFLTMYF